MTDHLKLSDPTGDAEIDKVVVAAKQEDRIQQLRKEIAALHAKLAEQSASAAPSPASGGNNKIGARKHGSFKAISTAPSINLTPRGPTMVPVPYPVVQDLSSSVNTARTVRFNGSPVYLLDASTQPHCTGDEQGTGKGIKSGTVSGEVKPVQGSSTVRVEGKQVVREGDACTMNGGNCPGIYVTIPPTSGAAPKDALATSNPPMHPTLQAAEARIKQWAFEMRDHLRNALKEPVEAGKGVMKSYANTLPESLELLLRAGMEQHAAEQENAALVSNVFGQPAAAKIFTETAAITRQQGKTIDLPKFTLNNAGQEGGDSIATLLQIITGVAGATKNAAKGIAKVSKASGKAASQGMTLGTAAGSDGIKVLSTSAARTIKQLERTELEAWLRDNHGITDSAKLKDMIDSFNLSYPIKLVELLPGTEVIQYVRENGAVGNFFAYPGTSPGALAITGDGRILTKFIVSEPVEALEGVAAEFPAGKYPGVGGPGGGTQIVAPKGSKSFEVKNH